MPTAGPQATDAAGSRPQVAPGQKRTAATLSPLPAPQGPAKESRPALGSRAQGGSQARLGRAPAPQTLARPREPAPRGSAGPFLALNQPTAVSRRAIKGPNPSRTQQSGASSGLLPGRGAPWARGGSGGPPNGRPQQQQPGGRWPRAPKGSPARGRPTAQSRSTAGSRQHGRGFARLPRPPQAKPGPPVSAGQAAPLGGGSPRGRRGSLKSRQVAVGPGQALKTPSAQDRRKLLEAWLASRGKCYKRPHMAFSAVKPPKRGKASLNHSFGGPMEEERKEQLHVASEIMRTLTECRKMAEEGFPLEELLALVSRIPEVERFAQFWICKAKVQAQQGPLDVAGLYEAAVRAGAVPLQELRNAITSILKTASKPAGAQPDHTNVLPEEEEEEEEKEEEARAVSQRFCHESLP